MTPINTEHLEGCVNRLELTLDPLRQHEPDALRRSFTQENLRLLCRECHRRKTRLDRCLAAFVRDCSMDWRTAISAWVANREWTTMFLAPLDLEHVTRSSDRANIQNAA